MGRGTRGPTLRAIGAAAVVSLVVAWSTVGARAAVMAVDVAAEDLTTTSSLPGPVQDALDLLFPTTSTSTTSTSSTTTSSTTMTSSTTTTTTPAPSCEGARPGRTDVGVGPQRITLGAVTVDSGPASSFLADQTTAIRAVVARVNAAGGVCGRTIDLEIRSSGWDPASGSQAIQDLSDEAFALVVNPDSQGLRRASEDGLLAQAGLPVIGTDGLFDHQFHDPFIWPVGPPAESTMRVIAGAQFDAGLSQPAVVYEATYGLGREAVDAYQGEWMRRSGAGISGYSTADGCTSRFCGIVAGRGSYSSEAASWSAACGAEPSCDASVVALDPPSALAWLRAGGGLGVAEPSGGAAAAPPLLFSRSFAQACGGACDGMRFWTAFRPPIPPFDTEPAVARYVEDVRAISASADVENQGVEAAYAGTELAIHVLTEASTMPGGLTRENVIRVLDSMSGWNSGLTLAPMSWSTGNHAAATTLHAFDLYSSGGPVFRYAEGSTRADGAPQP